nr:hypothetical protein [Pedobacter sp. ASV2]
MKIALVKNSFLIVLFYLTLLCCKNHEKNKVKSFVHTYKKHLNEKIKTYNIDSLTLFTHGRNLKINLNKIYLKNRLIYEVQVFQSLKLVDAFQIPYHFISRKDTLQADELRLGKSIISAQHKKVMIKNGFTIEFWQSKTVFQYVIKFDGKTYYLNALNRICENENLKHGIEICQVSLNDELSKISTKKIDSIINNFDNLKCN